MSTPSRRRGVAAASRNNRGVNAVSSSRRRGGVAAASRSNRRVVAVSSTPPRAQAPRDSDLSQVFASPFFIAFFILSITGGLPFLAWLRLSSLAAEDPDAPADLSDFVPDPVRDLSETLPTLPGLPGLPKIPGFGAAEVRDVELPGAVADVTGAKNTGGLIDKLPWNRDDYPLKARKGPGL